MKRKKKSGKEKEEKLVGKLLQQGAAAAERDIRLQCLNVAMETEGTTETVIRAAQSFFEWITAGKIPDRAPAPVVTLRGQ